MSNLTEPKCHKTKHSSDQDLRFELSPQSHILFYNVYFDKGNSKPTLANVCYRNSLSHPRHLCFFWFPPFQNLGTESCLPLQKKSQLILWYLAILLKTGTTTCITLSNGHSSCEIHLLIQYKTIVAVPFAQFNSKNKFILSIKFTIFQLDVLQACFYFT